MRYVIILLVLCGLAASERARAEDCVDTNLVLVVDSSWSVDEWEWQLQMEGYLNAFNNPAVVRALTSGYCGAVAVTLVRFGSMSKIYQKVGWTRISDPASASAFGAAVAAEPYESYIGTAIFMALEFSVGLLESAPYRAERNVIDISGDGHNSPGNGRNSNVQACNRAQKLGAVINGLPIVNDRPEPGETEVAAKDDLLPERKKKPRMDVYYENFVICGTGAFVEAAYGFDDVARAIKRKLERELIASLQ